jgi:hypothetical protein
MAWPLIDTQGPIQSATTALVGEAFLMADVPRRKGAANVVTLDDGQVTRVQYLQTETQLRQALAP